MDRNQSDTDNATPFTAAEPKRCYAYTPDDEPSHWKLKLCENGEYNARIIGAAKAALGKGYRGNRVQLPESARAGVIAKVNRAAKAVGLDPFDASELDPAIFDDPDASDVHVDGPMGAVSPTGALNRMRARLKGKLRHGVKLTQADIDEAHRHAKRAMPAKPMNEAATLADCDRQPWKSFDEDGGHSGLFVGCFLDDESAPKLALSDGEDADDLHITLAYVPDVDLGPVAFARLVVALDQAAGWTAPLDGKIGGHGRFYGSPTSDGKDVFYAAPDVPNLDQLRQRVLNALADCGISDPDPAHGWTPHVTLAYLDSDAADPTPTVDGAPVSIESLTVSYGDSTVEIPLRGGDAGMNAYAEPSAFRFAELKPFAEPPTWIQYLPTPGVYTHPSYGKVDLSKERIANFVQNFNSGIYQKAIPIDAEHQTKLSGATGYIREMRQASDGSAEARVEWTDRGEKLIRSDRMKFFSPEWYDRWVDPITETEHADVAIGGALTTRPFFKERALRPIAASEPGLIVWADDDAAESQPPVTRQGATKMAQDNATTPVAMTEEQITKRFNDLKAELEAKHASELEAIRTAAEERASKLAAEVETERKAREQAEADARLKRFTDEVRGRSDANGAAWTGDLKAHVALLDHLAKTAGEDSDLFKSYVADQRAKAQQFKDSALFKSFGSDASGEEGGTAGEQLNADARRIAKEKGVAFAVAYDEAVTANPKLYAEMRAGR